MSSVLELSQATVVRDGNVILDAFDWTVTADQRWVVLGPNGAGKTTLLRLCATMMHPTRGIVTVLGNRMGRSDLSEVRPRIGFASTALARRIPEQERVLDAVMTAAYAVLGRWREEYEQIDLRRAERVLAEWGLGELARRRYGTLSDGERKRVQIARAVMADPELLLLDEPTASLDLGSRESLLTLMSGYALEPGAPAIVLVTHHVEEIPRGFTHVLLLAAGRPVAAGPLAATLTEANLAATFGLDVELGEAQGRYSARARD